MATARAAWVVRCDQYVLGPFTQATAERQKDAVEKLGACHSPHTVEEVGKDA